MKLLLNLSKEEQRIRFLRRIDLPDHNWKFSSADVRERGLWDDYQHAFSRDALAHEHRLGPVVRDSGRSQVVRADRSGRGDRERAARDRSRYPTVTQEQRDNLLEIKTTLEAQAPAGAVPDPFEASLEADGHAPAQPEPISAPAASDGDA